MPSVGQLVSAKTGRDKGKKYIVTHVEDNNYVRLVDGQFRKISNPKKKNIKHLIVHRQIAQDIAEMITRNEKVTNQQIRIAISRLVGLSDQGREEGSVLNG